jgi:hypothetical protein
MAYIGVSPQNGVRKKHTYTASGSQTSFTGAGAEGITLSYKDSNFVDVYQNGVKLAEADYTSTSGTTIVLAQGAAANDIVEIIVYDVFSTSDMVSASDGGTFAGNVAMSGTLTLTGNGDFNGDLDVDGTLETDALTINGVTLAETISDTVGAMVSSNTETGITVTYHDGDNTLDFVVGTLNQDTTGTAANATLAATVTVTDSTANTNFPIVFHDESNALLDDTGALRYNPSTGELLVPKLTVAGTTTTVDTVTMNAANAVIFEGATADAHETTLTIVDPTADRTINLPNVSGTIPVLAAASNTAITSTPAELNILDGVTSTAAELNILDGVTSTAAELNVLDGITAVVGELNALDLGSTAVGTAIASKAVILDSNKDYTGIRNLTTTGVVTANAGIVVDNITIDGTQIDLSSGDFTLDVADNIILDSGDGDIEFRDTGTTFMNLYEDGSNNANFFNPINDADIKFQGKDNNSTITALTLDMSDGGTALFNHDIKLTDNSIAIFGTGNDLQIYHDGSDSNIADVGTGTLLLKTDGAGVYIQKGSSETLAQFKTDAEVNLYHDNSKKFETTSSGVTVTGGVTSTSNMTMGAGTQIQISGDGGSSGLQLLGNDSDDSIVGSLGSQALVLRTASTERMRIDSSGNVMVGITSTDHKFHVNQGTVNKIGGFFYNNTATNAACLKVLQDSASASGPALLVRNDGSGNSIEVDDGSDGNTVFRVAENGRTYIPEAYTSTTGNSANLFIDTDGRLIRATSSERYKNTITDATHGLAEVLKLRSVTYKGNNDGDTVFGGLIAEEVHDAGLTEFVQYNEDNKPDALAYGNMVSLCIKAIQELKAENTALANRITALESA